ncbi:endolytic transglycosylase MltG [Acanthopleuribacter pedis]|uniref:Endolytic murein transglycosylase n=1 Tax=Acanthopleuribacter pedis TaxID=442870 RepID=A0A8J7QD30_9BACT|nr:endolytic transglycosylase MltG [Acanthopleuribacter pedis]MBO1316838.1 endolytic transglycosylase MltG [Acanthopleuribacter pedis]
MPQPQHPSKFKRRIETLLKYVFVFLLLAHLGGLALYFFRGYQDVYRIRTVPNGHRNYSVPAGQSLTRLLKDLHQKDLAPQPLYVRLALWRHDPDILIKRGAYALPEKASTWDIIQLLGSGRVELSKLTIPEGLDLWETAKLLGRSPWGDEQTFLQLLLDPTPIRTLDAKATNLEGYLYPETYFFAKDATPQEIVNTIINHFREETKTLRTHLDGSGFTIREWVTMASLIEKETAVPDERARIAGVFANRTRRGMLLQCDPTIIYSLKLDNRYRGKIYKSDIRYDHPYNTYVYKGLPPGPIASPGHASLAATLAPEKHKYLYFVAKPDGTHSFNRSLREHNRDVARYRRR